MLDTELKRKSNKYINVDGMIKEGKNDKTKYSNNCNLHL
jgi:hypothetical protein